MTDPKPDPTEWAASIPNDWSVMDWRFVAVAFVAGAIIVAGIVLLVGRSGTEEPTE